MTGKILVKPKLPYTCVLGRFEDPVKLGIASLNLMGNSWPLGGLAPKVSQTRDKFEA